ncbi:MAG: calcium-binding protein, partial [Arthrospira sp. SH-MAG29]|nr:calcium-binding protein [Arthrospira sp. SH-MAG29]
IGGAGRDTFAIAYGQDTIADFEVGIDQIWITADLDPRQLAIAQIDTGSQIIIADTGEVLAFLNGVEATTIDIEDFTFF